MTASALAYLNTRNRTQADGPAGDPRNNNSRSKDLVSSFHAALRTTYYEATHSSRIHRFLLTHSSGDRSALCQRRPKESRLVVVSTNQSFHGTDALMGRLPQRLKPGDQYLTRRLSPAPAPRTNPTKTGSVTLLLLCTFFLPPPTPAT